MICPVDQTEFTPQKANAKYCSENCRIRAFRARNPVSEREESMNNLEDYLFSKQYTKDCQELVKRFSDKTTWGGVTRNGYTHYVTPEGVEISVATNRKT